MLRRALLARSRASNVGWAETKAKLKAVVHATFALPALYSRADGSAAFPTTVRVNNDVRVVGGGGTKGFMEMIQDIPKLRIPIIDMAGSPPKIEDRVSVPSEGVVFVIRNVNPIDGALFYVVEVEVDE